MNQDRLERVAIVEAIAASVAAKESERRLARLKRNEALQAILARLEAARAENAADYMAQRAHRETSPDLS